MTATRRESARSVRGRSQVLRRGAQRGAPPTNVQSTTAPSATLPSGAAVSSSSLSTESDEESEFDRRDVSRASLVCKEGVPFSVELERISRDLREWCAQMLSSSESSSPVAGVSENPRGVSFTEVSRRRELSSGEKEAGVFSRSVARDVFGGPDARLGRVDSRRAALFRAVDGAPGSCSRDEAEYEASVTVERQRSVKKNPRTEKMHPTSRAAGSKKDQVVAG
jgi:hypothetical protein